MTCSIRTTSLRTTVVSLLLLLVFLSLAACTGPARQPSSPVSTDTPTQSDLLAGAKQATDVPTATRAAPVAQPTDEPTDEPTAVLTVTATLTASPSPSPTVTFTPGPTATLAPDDWKSMPVIPAAISDTTRAIFQLGQLMGNDPHVFSKVGDCHSTLPYYLGDFDNPENYRLGPYGDLQETIDFFSGSFSRKSFATKVGLSSGAALAVLWNDWKECSRTETPLDCEYRLNKPAFAIISLGTNDVTDRASLAFFEDKMRRVIDHTIGKGIVPILVTKPDNAEGDHYINAVIARLAYEYEIPLWNFWAAIQELPGDGMMVDHPEHLSMPDDWSLLCNFENPENLKLGFVVRNLTALQVLDVVRKGVQAPAP